MGQQILTSLRNLITYIFDIRWYEIPNNLLYLGVLIAFSYIVGTTLIGFPCAIWRAIAKKKNVISETEEKVTIVVTGCIAVVALLVLFA